MVSCVQAMGSNEYTALDPDVDSGKRPFRVGGTSAILEAGR